MVSGTTRFNDSREEECINLIGVELMAWEMAQTVTAEAIVAGELKVADPIVPIVSI